MLIRQIALLVLTLECLVSWCWFTTPPEVELLVLAHLSMIGGVGVAAWLQTRPTLMTLGGALGFQDLTPVEYPCELKKAA